MHITFLLKGLLIGFAIAAPVGPIGVLCIQRTLGKGRAYGLFTGLGAATADALYGFVAAFGLAFISNFLLSQQLWIHLIGGLFILYLGALNLIAAPAQKAAQAREGNLLTTYATTLTLTNPLTILSFVAAFAAAGLGGSNRNYLDALLLVLGVFLGSAVWWLILSGGISLLRGRFNLQALRWVNKLSGVMLMAFALLSFLSLRS